MCTAAHPDVASSGRCTIAESPSRKCHGRCSQEGGHDREAVRSRPLARLFYWLLRNGMVDEFVGLAVYGGEGWLL